LPFEQAYEISAGVLHKHFYTEKHHRLIKKEAGTLREFCTEGIYRGVFDFKQLLTSSDVKCYRVLDIQSQH